MAKGISLHIGLNYVDPNHYSGWNGKLNAAEYDANDMYLIAQSQKIEPTILLGKKATRNAVIAEIKRAATILSANDLFMVTYSGHGGELQDMNKDENDGIDETWCLFDGELIDDELSNLWSYFQKGVRILVISDSCNSGTITKGIQNLDISLIEYANKFMPYDIAYKTYNNNKGFYDNILKNNKEVKSESIQASVKLISSSQDHSPSYDGTFNSQFTNALKQVWNGGNFNGNYHSFYDQIKNLLTSIQVPNYYNIGLQNQAFDNQKPFLK